MDERARANLARLFQSQRDEIVAVEKFLAETEVDDPRLARLLATHAADMLRPPSPPFGPIGQWPFAKHADRS